MTSRFYDATAKREADGVRSSVPPEAKVVAETSCYRLRVDPATRCVFVEVRSYHPETLVITPEGLEDLVRAALDVRRVKRLLASMGASLKPDRDRR